MLLEDFNYFMNKAVNQYINKRYNIYDISQQTTDDLRVLKATAKLPVTKSDYYGGVGAGASELLGATYEVNLPLDYLHMLNCVCEYTLLKRFKCYNAGDHVLFAAKRLTADSWSIIINDYYNRPLPQRPYYYIHNVNQEVDVPTNPITDTTLSTTTKGTDVNADYKLSPGEDDQLAGSQQGQIPRTINLRNIENKSVVERESGVRYGNATAVRCEIRYGHDTSVFELNNVYVDYIKAPQVIRLTQEQVNLTEDTSQVLEFPDYVCQEIINELVLIVQENIADPRLQTHTVVSQSIANPVQQQAQPQPQQQRG